MALDQDFYDNLQWDPEDAATLRDRGQMPLVYNEVAPMVDWVIGTERRTRVDSNRDTSRSGQLLSSGAYSMIRENPLEPIGVEKDIRPSARRLGPG